MKNYIYFYEESSGNFQTQCTTVNFVTAGSCVQVLGRPLEGPDPCANAHRPAEPVMPVTNDEKSMVGAPSTQMGRRTQDGVNLGTVVRTGPLGTSTGATASNLDTQSRSRDRSMSVHAVEFSKTVAPLQEGFLPQRRSRVRTAGPGEDRQL